MLNTSSYYNLDAILAEEELIPVTNLLDFSHLSHLDPNRENRTDHVLPEHSNLRIPLWACRKWIHLGFCRVTSPPKAYKSKHTILAEPSTLTLKPYWFHTGRLLTEIMHQAATNLLKSMRPGSSSQQREVMLQAQGWAKEWQQVLLQVYRGTRMANTIHAAFTSVGEDVSTYLQHLTQLEKALFARGHIAAVAHDQWKMYGGKPKLLLPTTVPNSNRNKRQKL